MIPPYGRRHRPCPDPTVIAFRVDPLARPLLALLGVRRAVVRVEEGRLRVRFGRWRVDTPLSNVVSAEPSGPFRAWRALGPRLSLADRGLTFGSSVRGGVCVGFAEPVRGLLPWTGLRHSALTVTVGDPDALVDALTAERRWASPIDSPTSTEQGRR